MCHFGSAIEKTLNFNPKIEQKLKRTDPERIFVLYELFLCRYT